MDRVLPNVYVAAAGTTAPLPAAVDRVFVVDADADHGGWDGVEVVDLRQTDLWDHDTFLDTADEVVYTVKGGRTVLLVRRPDSVLTVAVIARLRNDSYRQALTALEGTHGLDPASPPEELLAVAREYVFS